MRRHPEPHKPDPAVPLTWPLHWFFYQQWGRIEEGITDPFWWKIERVMPDFNKDDLLCVYRLGLHQPRHTVASGFERSFGDTKAAIESALHAANLELETYYLTPRISAHRYTTGTGSSFSGTYLPTPGGRP